jgi:hypothetical protein
MIDYVNDQYNEIMRRCRWGWIRACCTAHLLSAIEVAEKALELTEAHVGECVGRIAEAAAGHCVLRL